MRLGNIISFRKDLCFEGAVQADWFYTPEKAAKVAENFVFHGKDYYGIDSGVRVKAIDTISLTKTLSKKLLSEIGNPFSLAIADYGTGKSHLAVTLAQLFSGMHYMSETYNRVIDNIRKIDSEAASIIQSACNSRNFVLVINGMKDFNLHYELLRATQKSLRLYGLSDEKLRNLNRAVETASLFFERNKDIQITLFEESANKHGWYEKGKKLVEKIKETIFVDDETFNIVNDVYYQITGKEISWDQGISARSILEMILSEYCGLNGLFDHVIILFDEFGRYLEYASGSDSGKSGDSALQQIFEVAQDAEGALQVINFIQSDIKTYLVRVDQTRNISRYIGRYDQSDKYHISSNLETVIANLIYREDKDAFFKNIIRWQKNKEDKWHELYAKMDKWLTLRGVWGSYDLFRNVVVEGIYPMHPLSTFMVTQLSDYLQGRSSIKLISDCIDEVSLDDLDSGMPLVLPEKLMQGDLYKEMLSSENEGKQHSQHCICFDNILRKYGDKLSKTSLSVLRANLILRILRFKTQDYEDAKKAIMLCSGLSLDELEKELEILENEYALLGFDNHACCFDFLEESHGTIEYKRKKKKMAATWNLDLKTMFKTVKILELGALSEAQETSFGINHKILTNEWKFTQEIMTAEEFISSSVKSYLDAWKDSRGVATPKGKLIWIYINKYTENGIIKKVSKIASAFTNTPIIIMLLNDSESRLANALSNYDLLDKMDDKTRNMFARAYEADFAQAEEAVRSEFELLKKRREYITDDGVLCMDKRLQKALTDVFELLYSKSIPFNFDGLLTASNNLTGKGSTYFCQFIRMFLSNNVDSDTIHNFTSDVRSKINAVFMESSSTSWKCISNEYTIMPPQEKGAKLIYDEVVNSFELTKYYDCKTFFDTYCYPPYGLSEEACALLLCVIIANNNYRIRVQYKKNQNSIVNWKNDIIVNDKKINFDLIKESRLLLLDINAIEAHLQQLFNRLESLKDFSSVLELKDEIDNYVSENGVPESLHVRYQLAVKIFEKSNKAQQDWERQFDSFDEDLIEVEKHNNIYRGLMVLEGLEDFPVKNIFSENSFEFAEKYQRIIKIYKERSTRLIKEHFQSWLSEQNCKSVESMTQFEKHAKRCFEKLRNFGFNDQAVVLLNKIDSELAKKAEIKSRGELLADGNKFLSDYKNVSLNNYVEIGEMIRKSNAISERLKKYGESLGKDAIWLKAQLERRRLELDNAKKIIDEQLEKIWDNVAEAQTIADLNNVLLNISCAAGYCIPAEDLNQFEELKCSIEHFVKDMETLQNATSDRNFLKKTIECLRLKYLDSDYEFEADAVLENSINAALDDIDEKDEQWAKENLTLGDKSEETIYRWKEKTKLLPAFLKPETVAKVTKMTKQADKLISKAKIDYIVFAFNKLSESERAKCLELLKQIDC